MRTPLRHRDVERKFGLERRRGVRFGGRRFEQKNCVAVNGYFGCVSDAAGGENVAERGMQLMNCFFGKQAEKLAETIFRFCEGVRLFRRKRRRIEILLFVLAIKFVTKLFFVKCRVSLLYSIGEWICGRKSLGAEIVERLLEIAEVSARAHQRAFTGLAQRCGAANGSRAIAFDIG